MHLIQYILQCIQRLIQGDTRKFTEQLHFTYPRKISPRVLLASSEIEVGYAPFHRTCRSTLALLLP